MNVISISGQLGKDAEQKFLPDGTAILNFSVADSQGRDKPTIWWNCAIFGKRAESGLAQYLVKGQAVTVNGNVTMREYTDKDGNKRQAQDIRVQDVALQGGGKPQGNATPADREPTREESRNRQHAASRPVPNFSDMDEDIPF